MYKYGKVADYIPALAQANPQDLGLSIKLENGGRYNFGDADKKFTIQSISKIFTLLLALEDRGEDYVFSRVGYEGSSDEFNRFYKFESPESTIPTNPMMNLGAIQTTSLIKGLGDEKFQRILEFFRLISKNPKLDYSREVYMSESQTGNRNRAMAYLLKSKGLLEGQVEDVLDTYFKQCSIEVTTEDLSNMGDFLNKNRLSANKELISDKRHIKIILSIMNNSGMYNFSGEYGAKVGIPAKSGVGGGILAVSPRKMAIGVYSPSLDERGNSIVGYNILKNLSEVFDLSIF